MTQYIWSSCRENALAFSQNRKHYITNSAETKPTHSTSGEKDITFKGQRERRQGNSASSFPFVFQHNLNKSSRHTQYSPDFGSTGSSQQIDSVSIAHRHGGCMYYIKPLWNPGRCSDDYTMMARLHISYSVHLHTHAHTHARTHTHSDPCTIFSSASGENFTAKRSMIQKSMKIVYVI